MKNPTDGNSVMNVLCLSHVIYKIEGIRQVHMNFRIASLLEK